jgi:hypothetical protein
MGPDVRVERGTPKWQNGGQMDFEVEVYWRVFVELVRTPFQHIPLVWGIVPLYFGLFLSELTSAKANFRTAIQTGFSFIWAGAQWLYPYFKARPSGPHIELNALLPVNLFVTFAVLALGVLAVVSGLRRHYPKHCSFLGYTRFSNYFMIMIFPMQAHVLAWSWERVAVIALFAAPIWLILHFGLMPLRK